MENEEKLTAEECGTPAEETVETTPENEAPKTKAEAKAEAKKEKKAAKEKAMASVEPVILGYRIMTAHFLARWSWCKSRFFHRPPPQYAASDGRIVWV